MKALKITLLLVAIVVLTVSVVSKESAVHEDTNTYKEYAPKNLVLDRKKAKLKSAA